jgi:biotin carboxyl carrier protein
MPEKTLIARVRDDADHPGQLVVTSPVVGAADGFSRTGVFLNPLDQILTLKILGERWTLRLPRNTHGRVVQSFLPDAVTPVDFDQPLLLLDPRVLHDGQDEATAAAEAGAGAEGTITVPAPSEGIFYRRPSPDSAPFVEVGTKVRTGTVLGMVEVMKCFNQIAYGGPGLPEEGEITEILAGDAAEVQFGQALFRVRPTGG